MQEVTLTANYSILHDEENEEKRTEKKRKEERGENPKGLEKSNRRLEGGKEGSSFHVYIYINIYRQRTR